MKNQKPSTPFSPYEIRRFIMPPTLASILALAGMIYEAAHGSTPPNLLLIGFGLIGITYLILSHIVLVRSILLHKSYNLLNSLLVGPGLGLLSLSLPKSLSEVSHILIILWISTIAILSGRRGAYISLSAFLAISLSGELRTRVNAEAILEYLVPIVVACVATEIIVSIKDTTKQQIHRLETINKVSRQIMRSLDTQKTLSLLDATIQETLSADTHFIGLLDGDKIRLELFYDDGEYFNGTSIPIQGTLSGWVIRNQKELFLPDLREETALEGVEQFIFGKEKTNLSWIGVPLKAENVTGVLALASYTANAFDRADFELLASLGQHVTLALDNTIRHAQVENQARLDSLTGVYNHGYFLKMLSEQAEAAMGSGAPLSLIMLDIDHFKQYNDTYGHLVGDRILNALCTVIQQHIKQTDAVGRWGGEEFVISLPGANGKQAHQIARRVSETMRTLRVVDRDQQTVPIPTVSQGIAVFPQEADEIYRLIDKADRRLYVAKERGRDQVEPGAEFWTI